MEKRIAIVVPVFNEEGNVELLAREVERVLSGLNGFQYELVFVDDGSTDESVARIEALVTMNPHVRLVALSRNFGKEAALSAGIAESDADALILMDADLQHPPEHIPELIAKWEAGADVVIGVRRSNPDGGLVRALGSKLFSYIMSRVSGVPTVPGATDFRLIDRAVAEEFTRFTERSRITRGLIDWLGFSRAYVSFEARTRNAGAVQYSLSKLAGLGLSALIAHSLLPLRVAGYLGFLITFFAGGLGIFVVIEQFLLGDPLGLAVSGTAMLAIMILFLNGILLISLGLVALYIAQIHRESMNRPLYIVRKRARRA